VGLAADEGEGGEVSEGKLLIQRAIVCGVQAGFERPADDDGDLVVGDEVGVDFVA
jgi:hypothetical protein